MFYFSDFICGNYKKCDVNNLIPDDIITNKIYLIRERKVMLDRDLAQLYNVETKAL